LLLEGKQQIQGRNYQSKGKISGESIRISQDQENRKTRFGPGRLSPKKGKRKRREIISGQVTSKRGFKKGREIPEGSKGKEAAKSPSLPGEEGTRII